MAIALSDLKLYGSATMPDDDSSTAIGGAIDKAKKAVFTDVAGAVQIVSDQAADTSVITVTFRDTGGNIVSSVASLSGLTPVAPTGTPERLLKAVKTGSTAGNVAVEAVSGEVSATAQAGGDNTITLAAGDAQADQYYRGMIIRLTGGTGVGQIREIIDYQSSTKIATVNANWSANPNGTSVYKISKGFFMDKTPNEITQVRRVFYNAGANPPGGAEKKYYEKLFFWNNHGSLDLTTAIVTEEADPSGLVTFGLEAALDGTNTNGANNRQVAPAGITFDSANKNVSNGQSLTHGKAQPVWLCLTLVAGAAALKTSYTLKLVGNTV